MLGRSYSLAGDIRGHAMLYIIIKVKVSQAYTII